MANHNKKLIIGFILMLTSTWASAICAITGNDVSFGVFSAIFVKDSLGVSSATLTLQCTKDDVGKSYNLKIPAGTNGSINHRQLGNGDDALDYGIYLDASHTALWGDGTQGTTYWSGVVAETNSIQIYFKIKPGQIVSAGNYSDSIGFDIDF